MISTLRFNSNLKHLNIDTDSPDSRACIEELCRTNSKIELWNRKFRDLVTVDNKIHYDGGLSLVLLCPMVWSKFSRVRKSFSVVFELVKEYSIVFISNAIKCNQI